MSIQVIELVEDAAIAIGDPRKTRVKMNEWTSFTNRALRELSQKADVCQYRAKFNLGVQAVYGYPAEMRTMTGIDVSETPDDDDSWRPLGEKFQDEFRAFTDGRYPDSTLPEFYFADSVGFYLMPRPSAFIENGGRITYFGMADRISDANTATFQLIEIAQDYIIKRLIIFGLRARNRHSEADAEMRQWVLDVEGLQDSLEDRSNDRRSSLRPRGNRYAGHR